MSVKRRTLLAALGAAGVSTLTTGDDEMSKFGPAAFSQGDIMRRIRQVESELNQLRTARNLQSAAIGGGGLRIHSGGGIRVQGTEEGEEDVFRVGSDPAELHLREDLLAPLVRLIFAEGIMGVGNSESDTLSNTFPNWVDLDTPGPAVTGVEIGESGRALVIVGADIVCSTNTTNAQLAAGMMSFEVTGATQQEPNEFERAYTRRCQIFFEGTDQLSVSTGGNGTKMAVVTGLNPGQHNFTAKYSATTIPESPAVDPVNISDRFLGVIPF